MSKRYTLYIDESGVANLCEYRSRFFILSAVVIEESIEKELTAYFNFIKKKYGIPCVNNLHAVGLFEVKESDFYITHAKCKNFCVSVSDFIAVAPLNIWTVCLDKELLRKMLKMPKGYAFKGTREHKDDKDIGYEILARRIFLEFGKFLKGKSAQGSIVAESRRGSDYQLMSTFLGSQEPNQFENQRLKKYSEALRNRVYSITFENKHGLSGGLELADLISYITNQKLNRKLAPLERRGAKKLWQSADKKGKLNSLSVRLFNKLASDRIHKVAVRIKERLVANSDIVNPT